MKKYMAGEDHFQFDGKSIGQHGSDKLSNIERNV